MTPQARKFLFGLVAAAIPLFPLLSFFTDWRVAGGVNTWLANGLLALGGVFSVMNFYYTFLRAPLLMTRGHGEKSIRHVSPIPLLGILVVPGLLLAPPSTLVSVASVLLILVDTGSISWFVALTWNDDASWVD